MSALPDANIVRIFVTGEVAGRGNISRALLESMTLSIFIKAFGYLPPPIAIAIALAVCETLTFIHQQGATGHPIGKYIHSSAVIGTEKPV